MKLLHFLWWIAPFHTVETLDLPMPAQTAMVKLLTVVDGSWSIDGGIRYRRSMRPYREIHQYSGVVNGHTFQVVGPFGFGLIPMHIYGELQEDGRSSRLHLTLDTSLGASLLKMSQTIILLLALLDLGGIACWFVGIDMAQIGSVALFILLAGGFFLAVIYMNLIWLVHRQTALLLNRFSSQFGAFS